MNQHTHLSRRPRQRFLEASSAQQAATDEYGFLDPMVSDSAIQVDQLLNYSVVTVVSPPWLGKTYFATQLDTYLREQDVESREFDRAELASFELPVVGKPSWWDTWKAGKQRACWILDSVDEDLTLNRGSGLEVVRGLIRQLEPSERRRLCVVLLGRENEIPADLLKRIGFDQDPERTIRVRLQQLSGRDAGALVGEEALERIKSLIKANRLTSVAGFPAVLKYLSRQRLGETVSTGDVWRGVLSRLLEYDVTAKRRGASAPAERFKATSRIAASLLLSGQERVSQKEAFGEGLDVATLIAHDEDQRLLRAADESLHFSSVFVSDERGYRFRARNVQEWFTAFALSELPLERLRSLATDTEGTMYPQLADMLAMLHRCSSDPRIRKWVSEQLGTPGLDDVELPTLVGAKDLLERLLEIAAGTRWGLSFWSRDAYQKLNVPGMGREIVRRLADSSLDLPRQRLLLDIGEAIQAAELVPFGIEYLKGPKGSATVRNRVANSVVELASDCQVEELVQVVYSVRSLRRLSPETLGQLALTRFHRGLISLPEALAFVPTDGDDDHLGYHLSRRMSCDDAWAVLRATDPASVQWENATAGTFMQVNRPGLVLKALGLAAGQETHTSEEFATLHEFTMQVVWHHLYEVQTTLARAFAKSASARRSLFAAGLELGTKGNGTWLWRSALKSEDIEWALGQYVPLEAQPKMMLNLFLGLASLPETNPRQRAKVRRQIRAIDPELVEEFDHEVRQIQEMNQESARLHVERKEPEQFRLRDLVDEVLNSDQDLRTRLHRVSRLCLVEEPRRPTNVQGGYSDLESNTKVAIRNFVADAILRVEPTAIPDGNRFPSGILYEAAAWIWLHERSDGYEGTESEVARWLPSLLKTSIRRNRQILSAYADRYPDTVADVVVAELRRQLCGGSTSLPSEIPSNVWRGPFSARLFSLLDDANIDGEACAALLRRAAEFVPELSHARATEWLALDGSFLSNDRRLAALDVVVALAPREGVALLRRAWLQEGQDVLMRVRSLQPHYYGVTAGLSDWPAAALKDLSGFLETALPREQDPVFVDGEVRSVGAEDELRDQRNAIPKILYRRSDPESRVALSDLEKEHKWIAAEIRQRRADERAEMVLAGSPSTLQLPIRTSVEDVVRALAGGLPRLVRSGNDLWRVVIEQLEAITRDANEHLACLYGAMGREKGPRKRLSEDALQAYICCRLRDRLESRLREAKVQPMVNREALSRASERVDILIQAQTGSGAASVVVEIKWSDNDGVSTALQEQLGERYLLGGGKSYSVYFVGFSGKWAPWKKRAQSSRPKTKTIDDWTTALVKQAARFEEENAGLHIAPIVVDLRWSEIPKR